MTQIKQLAALLLGVILFSACSDEEAPLPTTEVPSIVLTEKMITDAGTGIRTEEFYYNENEQLTRRVVIQKTTVAVGGYTDTDSLRLEHKVSYSDREVTVTDAFDNVSTYLLNDKGYATSCIRREGKGTNTVRVYTFAYSDDSSLTEIMETINGETHSRVTLQASTTTTTTIRTENGDMANTFLLTLGEENTSRLPWLYLTELYPLSLHQEAMYAQLLGKAPKRLIQTIQPEGGDEVVTYTYTTDEASNLSSCTENIRSEGFTYNRTIKYSINPEKR